MTGGSSRSSIVRIDDRDRAADDRDVAALAEGVDAEAGDAGRSRTRSRPRSPRRTPRSFVGSWSIAWTARLGVLRRQLLAAGRSGSARRRRGSAAGCRTLRWRSEPPRRRACVKGSVDVEGIGGRIGRGRRSAIGLCGWTSMPVRALAGTRTRAWLRRARGRASPCSVRAHAPRLCVRRPSSGGRACRAQARRRLTRRASRASRPPVRGAVADHEAAARRRSPASSSTRRGRRAATLRELPDAVAAAAGSAPGQSARDVRRGPRLELRRAGPRPSGQRARRRRRRARGRRSAHALRIAASAQATRPVAARAPSSPRGVRERRDSGGVGAAGCGCHALSCRATREVARRGRRRRRARSRPAARRPLRAPRSMLPTPMPMASPESQLRRSAKRIVRSRPVDRARAATSARRVPSRAGRARMSMRRSRPASDTPDRRRRRAPVDAPARRPARRWLDGVHPEHRSGRGQPRRDHAARGRGPRPAAVLGRAGGRSTPRRGASAPPRGTAASSATGSRSGGCARA